MTLGRIVSGAQTGVDRGALDAALKIGFACGGWCPPGRLAEDGVIPPRYPVHELDSGGYRKRTIQNVMDSDGTLVIHFGGAEGGTALTLGQCGRCGKPHLSIDASATAAEHAASLAAAFVIEHQIRTLNVAGPRASKEPGAHQYSFLVTTQLLRTLIVAHNAL